MQLNVVEEKIKELPEVYVSLVDEYVDQLLEKTKKINALRGVFSSSANENNRNLEKNAWKHAALEKRPWILWTVY